MYDFRPVGLLSLVGGGGGASVDSFLFLGGGCKTKIRTTD